MLSPASLRVCCLAVMAPALSKADRRADCLPVVFPEPFNIPKTADTINSEDNINKITFSKFSYKTAWQPSYRKVYMQKACLRTNDRTKHGFPIKTKYSAFDVRKSSALYNGITSNASSKNKPWHAAFADKLRLKYTMSKNNFANKNMGLAKANAALGLQDLKKMKKISQLNLSEEETSILESDGGSSPDVIEKINSDFHNRTSLTVVSPVSEDVLKKNHISEHDCDLFLPSSSLDGLPTDEFNPVVSLRDEGVNRPKECLTLNHPISDLGSEVRLSASELSAELVTQTAFLNKLSSRTVVENEENSTIPTDCSQLSLCLQTHETIEDHKSSLCLQTHETIEDHKSASELSCESSRTSNENTDEFPESVVNNLSLDSMLSNLQPSPEVGLFPDKISLLSFDDSCERVPASTLFSSEISDIGNTCLPSITSHLLDVIGLEKSLYEEKSVQKDPSQVCCKLTNDEHRSISEMLSEKERKLASGIYSVQLLQCRQMCAHVKNQIQNLVGHYQKKLDIACQVQEDPNGSTPAKDMLDLKAELFQNDVKSLSTAALVNLVCKLEPAMLPVKPIQQESQPIQQESALVQQESDVPNVEISSEKADVVLHSDDYSDVKHTSSVLLKNLKNLLKSADRDLTDESADEENSVGLKIEDASSIPSSNQKKCLMEHTSLHSRSSWVIARMQELEYQRRIHEEKFKETKNIDGDVCFEESASDNAALSCFDVNSISERISTKQTSLKNCIRPVNGYLDHHSLIDPTNISYPLHASTLRPKSPSMPDEDSCSRTRPLKAESFHKRRLIYKEPVTLNSKVSKFSTVSCYCNSLNVMEPCILCAGRYNSVQSVDPDTMPVQDRIALLDSNYHPVLSSAKEVPLGLHFENTLKLNEAQYQTFKPVSPIVQRKMKFGSKPKRFSELRNHRKYNRYARSYLTAKYRNKHLQNSKHLRKHRLYFGKWRRLNRHSFHSRDYIRRFSVASSVSSHDSPVLSPFSIFDEGSVLDYMKKRRDDDQFDIDDVILPLNSRIGRTVEVLKYKDIACPSWRCEDKQGTDEMEEIEPISDAIFYKRHDRLEVEERKQLRRDPLGLNKRARRMYRCDSRADSSGANTPDPVLLCNQDILFQMPNNSLGTGPSSPALSPPTTPSSTAVISDDSQPPFGNGTSSGLERKKSSGPKRVLEDSKGANETVDVQPYPKRVYPLADEELETLVAASMLITTTDDVESQHSEPSCPASPESYSSSTSTVEEEDITDPEWTVVKRESGPSQALVLKFAKR